MELIEKHDLLKIHYLNQMTFKEFKPYAGSTCKNEDARVKRFNMMKDFCKNIIKTRGEIKRLYSYSLLTLMEHGGRLYCGNSIQGLPSKIRGFLMSNTTDIDMKNAHPTILRYICKKYEIPCPNLEYYILHRDEILAEFPDADKAKKCFLASLNDCNPNIRVKNKTFQKFDIEMKYIQNIVTNIECYKNIKSSVPIEKQMNWNGSAINRIMCMFENQILQIVIGILNHRSIEISALMFDGIMPYGNFYEDAELLEYITTEVESECEGLNMIWAYKSHSTNIIMPEDFKIPIEKVITDIESGTSFEEVSKEFEKTHCKIVNKSFYIKQTENDVVIFPYPKLVCSYSHMNYQVYDKEKQMTLTLPFLIRWTGCEHNIKLFEDVEIYPDMDKCPKNIFNLWRPFVMEKVMDYEHHQEGLDMILNHIKILCNNDVGVADYFVKWIAQMIQYPAVKSICPTLISKEGAGKGTLIQLITKMLGGQKVLETSTPSRDVWGDFNGVMSNAFFVNLNELSKKETVESEGKIKALITDNAMTINQKGVNQYKIRSFHRFIITTNKEEPINTTKGDRRNIIISSSNEKKGDTEYFSKLYELLDNTNVIKTCYEYFKSIPDMDKFGKIPMPETEYQNNLKELSVSPIELFVKSIVEKNNDKEEVCISTKDLFSDFYGNWLCNNGYGEYKITNVQFGVRLANLNITGVSNKILKTGKVIIFNIPTLKITFNISICNVVIEDEVDNEIYEEEG